MHASCARKRWMPARLKAQTCSCRCSTCRSCSMLLTASDTSCSVSQGSLSRSAATCCFWEAYPRAIVSTHEWGHACMEHEYFHACEKSRGSPQTYVSSSHVARCCITAQSVGLRRLSELSQSFPPRLGACRAYGCMHIMAHAHMAFQDIMYLSPLSGRPAACAAGGHGAPFRAAGRATCGPARRMPGRGLLRWTSILPRASRSSSTYPLALSASPCLQAAPSIMQHDVQEVQGRM